MPKPTVYVGYFPEPASTSVDRILILAGGHNFDLRVGRWRTLNRVQRRPTTELTLAVDPFYTEALHELGSLISCGYGKVTIHRSGPTASYTAKV